MRTEQAKANLRVCPMQPEDSSPNDAISTKITCAGPDSAKIESIEGVFLYFISSRKSKYTPTHVLISKISQLLFNAMR